MVRLRTGWVLVASLALAVGLAAAVRADAILPARDGSYSFFYSYGLGYSDGNLYVHTGNTIYQFNPNNQLFTSVATNLESAFPSNPGPSPRPFAGGFATGPGGQAMVTFGYPDGGVLAVNLSNGQAQSVPALDTANVYSGASNTAGRFIGVLTTSDYSVSTRLEDVNTGTLTAQDIVDVAPGATIASGGLAFDSAGNLVVGTLDYSSNTVAFYQISASELAAYYASGTTPSYTLLGQGTANGDGNIVVANSGDIYFDTTTGIGVLNHETGTVSNFLGDINDPNLFNYGMTPPYQGLAYNPTTNQIVFAQEVGTGSSYTLSFVTVPEPASLLLLCAGGLLLAGRRGRPSQA